MKHPTRYTLLLTSLLTLLPASQLLVDTEDGTIIYKKNSKAAGQRGALFFKHYDRNRDGFISQDEMSKKLKRHYRSYDHNGDGRLDRQEFSNLRGGKVQRYRNNKLFTFNHYDRNRDGLIVQGEMSLKLKRQFASYDYNGDGMLNRKEFRALRQGYVDQSRYRSTNPNSFYYYDNNGDGYIVQGELRGKFQGHFFAFDSNGDGRISHQEFQQGKQQRYQQQRYNQGYGGLDQQDDSMGYNPDGPSGSKDEYDKIFEQSSPSDLY